MRLQYVEEITRARSAARFGAAVILHNGARRHQTSGHTGHQPCDTGEGRGGTEGKRAVTNVFGAITGFV